MDSVLNFDGRLTKFGTVITKDGDVLTEFVITHKSSDVSILDGLSGAFTSTTGVSNCMNYPVWKSVAFDITGAHMKLTFNEVEEMKMPVELVGVKISNKDNVYTYNFTFTKISNPNVDGVFANAYYKRKELDSESNKMVTRDYDVLLVK